jgi:hypothetical protein
MRLCVYMPLAVFLVTVCPCTAQTTRPAVQMTLYADPNGKSGHALVRQERTVELVAGENRFELTDIPETLDPASVMLTSISGPAAMLREHSLRINPMSPDKLLESYIGRDVLINRKQPGNGESARHPETINAKLLGFDANSLVLGTTNRQLPIEIIPRSQDVTEVKLVGQSTRQARTALPCRVMAQASGPAQLEMTYRAGGISWSANYVLCLSGQDHARIGCVMAIENASGHSYSNAAVRLASAVEGQEIRIPGLVDLPDQTIQHVSLIQMGKDLAVSRMPVLVVKGPVHGLSRLDEFIRIEGESGFGTPLPPGKAQIYARRADGELAERGLAELAFTPANAPLLVKTGTAQGVYGEASDTDLKTVLLAQGLSQMTRSRQIRLVNQQKEAVRALVIEDVIAESQILESSDQNSRTEPAKLHFTIDIPAGGEKRITYAARWIQPAKTAPEGR